MTIKRTINATSFNFELTATELFDAFREQQHKFDVEAIENYGNIVDPENMEDEFGCSYSEFVKMKDDMAEEMRRLIDEEDYSWDYARAEAVDNIIKQYKGVMA